MKSSKTVGYIGVATDMTEQHKAARCCTTRTKNWSCACSSAPGAAQSHTRLESEMAERVKVEAMMRDMAHYDAITGLPNRSLLHDRLGQVLRCKPSATASIWL